MIFFVSLCSNFRSLLLFFSCFIVLVACCTHTHTNTHSNTHKHKHTHSHTQTHTHKHAHTNTHTQHTHTHTHTHTDILICVHLSCLLFLQTANIKPSCMDRAVANVLCNLSYVEDPPVVVEVLAKVCARPIELERFIALCHI